MHPTAKESSCPHRRYNFNCVGLAFGKLVAIMSSERFGSLSDVLGLLLLDLRKAGPSIMCQHRYKHLNGKSRTYSSSASRSSILTWFLASFTAALAWTSARSASRSAVSA